ncbi:hypothetical protein [Sphingobacterium sp. SRCM116780]|nr:hypothetical protein [Sphingobacterium sp. SRCM116780]
MLQDTLFGSNISDEVILFDIQEDTVSNEMIIRSFFYAETKRF